MKLHVYPFCRKKLNVILSRCHIKSFSDHSANFGAAAADRNKVEGVRIGASWLRHRARKM